jgi:hypothetical protein
MLRMIRTRFAAVLVAAAAFAAAASPVSAAPGNGPGVGGPNSNAQSAQDDHKPAGTGSGRKIG